MCATNLVLEPGIFVTSQTDTSTTATVSSTFWDQHPAPLVSFIQKSFFVQCCKQTANYAMFQKWATYVNFITDE